MLPLEARRAKACRARRWFFWLLGFQLHIESTDLSPLIHSEKGLRNSVIARFHLSPLCLACRLLDGAIAPSLPARPLHGPNGRTTQSGNFPSFSRLVRIRSLVSLRESILHDPPASARSRPLDGLAQRSRRNSPTTPSNTPLLACPGAHCPGLLASAARTPRAPISSSVSVTLE